MWQLLQILEIAGAFPTDKQLDAGVDCTEEDRANETDNDDQRVPEFERALKAIDQLNKLVEDRGGYSVDDTLSTALTV